MTEGKEMSPRRIYVLTLAIAVAAASAVCLYHGLRTGKDSVLGLTAQAEKYFGVESAELVLAQKRGDYMAALLRNADGSPFMALYQRDTLFRDRWQAVGGTSSFAPGTMDSWNYGDPKGNAVLISPGWSFPPRPNGTPLPTAAPNTSAPLVLTGCWIFSSSAARTISAASPSCWMRTGRN